MMTLNELDKKKFLEIDQRYQGYFEENGDIYWSKIIKGKKFFS